MNITKTWKGDNACNFKGFRCFTPVPGTNLQGVSGADFNGYKFNNKFNNLTFDNFIEKLKDVVFFHANSNKFTGRPPFEISNLKFFYELDLSNNKLVGMFPREVLSFSLLLFLDLRFNTLAGPIPPEVFKLDLRALFLNNNQFSGYLPSNLFNSPILYLTVANNQLTGVLPNNIGKAADSLIEVLFLKNKLSGCLPYEIGLLKKNRVFDVSVNQFRGPIPHSFSCLKEIRVLNLSYNQFSGAVPEMVCELPNLLALSLNNNYFTQVGPGCRKLMKQNKIDVSMNCIIDLPNQKSKEECAKYYSKLQPCPNEKFLTMIPCKNSYTATSQQESASDIAMAPSPTYAALDREYRGTHN